MLYFEPFFSGQLQISVNLWKNNYLMNVNRNCDIFLFEFLQEVDPKAGGGTPSTIGQMVQAMLIKQDWFSTLFPRIPVPVAKVRWMLFILLFNITYRKLFNMG